ncbi:glycoside hydrolase [Lasiosphaeria miniovina]|uniref:lytic cellulose monooxygenase (C4-dehydrogenating) n=1 Tax=Lasiosphaeria miniovina TaxID=1954250 RepID=A0AA40AMW9_9PEZI|nr:glycoside hydrolase [Lasiosphaeria miniovina]KAK0718647.1 glycoside hydrolase [Lasiosphaeria miniovina]
MKSLLLLAALAVSADAHYIFNILMVNGKKIGGEYTYVRRNSNSYNPAFPDIVEKADLRCNVGAKPGGSVQTYSVQAGDRVGFKVFNNELIEHPGPGFIYFSRAPEGGVATYDGSGDWFKVNETGLCGTNPGTDRNWCSYNKDKLEFTVPAKTPPGEYLVRVEHIGLHEGHKNRAQFYITCAQLKIDGPGGGTPGPLVKIPGIYKQDDPGIRYDKWTSRPAPYVMPGPAVWDGN